MEEANRVISEIEAAYPEAPDTLYLRAKYDFFQGDYKKALDRIDRAIAASPRGEWQIARENIGAVEKVTREYTRHVSPKGYFEVFIQPGRDEVLLPSLLRRSTPRMKRSEMSLGIDLHLRFGSKSTPERKPSPKSPF